MHPRPMERARNGWRTGIAPRPGVASSSTLRVAGFGRETSMIERQGDGMNAHKHWMTTAAVAALLLGLGACSNMSQRDKNTAIGAGIGAATGAVLTQGSPLGTVGGAAVGGVIGNQVGK